MQKKHSTLVKKIVINTFVVTLCIGGLTNSLCTPEPVKPGDDKYCLTKITNYYIKSDGTVKLPKEEFGYVKSDASGNCPLPIIIWENQ